MGVTEIPATGALWPAALPVDQHVLEFVGRMPEPMNFIGLCQRMSGRGANIVVSMRAWSLYNCKAENPSLSLVVRRRYHANVLDREVDHAGLRVSPS